MFGPIPCGPQVTWRGAAASMSLTRRRCQAVRPPPILMHAVAEATWGVCTEMAQSQECVPCEVVWVSAASCAVDFAAMRHTPPRCRPERVQLLKARLTPCVLLLCCCFFSKKQHGVPIWPFQEFLREFCSDDEFVAKRRKVLRKRAGLGDEDRTKV